MLICVLAVVWAPAETDQTPVFHSGVSEVVLDVQVVDKATGRIIDDLKKEDFIVSDEGQTQKLIQFDFALSPLDVALLLDISGSMVQATRELSQGASAALESLQYDDRVAVMSFSSKDRLLVGLTKGRKEVLDAIHVAVSSVTRVDPGTRLYDALGSAVHVFDDQKDPLRQRTVLAISDDKERSSRLKIGPLTTLLLDAGIIANAIVPATQDPVIRRSVRVGLPIPGIPPIISRDSEKPVLPPSLSMKPIIAATGGEVLTPANNRDALTEMFRRMRARYHMSYKLGTDNQQKGYHRLSVALSKAAQERHPDVTVRSREGFDL